MEELVNKLNEIQDSYFGFVAGIVTYAKKKPERLKKVMDFMDSSADLISSDIVKFVMQQPDFIYPKEKFLKFFPRELLLFLLLSHWQFY